LEAAQGKIRDHERQLDHLLEQRREKKLLLDQFQKKKHGGGAEDRRKKPGVCNRYEQGPPSTVQRR